MHFLIGAAVLAGLIGFAFGEAAARAFVGVLLTLAALAVLGAVGIVVIDSSRQEASIRPTNARCGSVPCNLFEDCMPADAHWQYPIKRCPE